MNYRERLYQLLDYIDSNLDDDLTVEKLSSIACLSKHHFHRQFSSLFGITAFVYIRQARMKRASYQLAFKKDMKIIDIAFANNYESSEAFSRAFSLAVGLSPSQFREQPDWKIWETAEEKLKRVRNQRIKSIESDRLVEIVSFKEVSVAAITHVGALYLIGNTIKVFNDWCGQNNIAIEEERLFNIVYDDPETTEPDKYTCEICVSTELDIAENKYGVVGKVIPSGKYAVIRHIGPDQSINQSISYLYAYWLEESDEELRDSPIFFERISIFPNVPEAQVTTDIYLPLV